MEYFNFSKVLKSKSTYTIDLNEKLLRELKQFVLSKVSDEFKKSFDDEVNNRIYRFEKTLKEHLLAYGGNLNRMSYYNLSNPFSREMEVYRRFTLFVDDKKVSCGDLVVENPSNSSLVRFEEEASYMFQKVLQVKDYISVDSELYKIIFQFVSNKIKNIDDYFEEERKLEALKCKVLFSYFLDDSFSFLDAIQNKEYFQISQFVQNLGLCYSEDENFYLYLLSKIKRSDGYQERKYNVLCSAINNGIVSNNISESIDKLTKKYRWQICSDLKEIGYNIKRKKSYLKEKGIYEDIKKYHSGICAKVIANSSSEIQSSKLSECLNISDKIFTLPILTKHLSSYYLNRLKEEIENARK